MIASAATDALDLVISRLDRPRRSGDGWAAHCPAHEDRNPSLSVRPGTTRAVVVRCFRDCQPEAILGAMGFNGEEVRAILTAGRDGRVSSATSSYRPQRSGPAGLTVAELARKKGLPERDLRELGLRDAIGRRAVEIPYRDATGRVLFVRTRTESKTLQPAGISLAPYGLDRLDDWRAASERLMVEGESDCWTARHHGRAALGLPGANSAGSLQVDVVEGVQRLYVLQEPDAGGPAFYTGIRQRLTALGWQGDVYAFGLVHQGRRIKDLSDLHLAVAGDREAFAATLAASIAAAVLVDLDAEQVVEWAEEQDERSWPAAARERIAELEAKLAGTVKGSDGAATCDGNCPTSQILREQISEHKAADRLLRDGPFSLGTAALVRYLVDQTIIGRANGRERVPLWRPDVASAINTNEKAISRAWADLEALQQDPEIRAGMPFFLDRRKDDRGKEHVDLVIPFLDQPPSRRQMLVTTARLPRLKATPGGQHERRTPPNNPDCRGCGAPMTTHRNRQDVCENDACGKVVTYPTQIIRPRLQQAVMMHGDLYTTIAQAEDPGDPGQLVPDDSGTCRGQVVPGSAAPRRLIPVSMVSRDALEAAASPHYWGEAPPDSPEPPSPPPAGVRLQRPSWRCACGSLERYPTDPGTGECWRCDSCGARGVEHPQMAIAGGSE